jgi:L-2-hydroxyglutarate oxidase LhgO
VQRLEPSITAEAGLLSPSTGILSVHDFMRSLDAALQSYGGMVVTHTRVVGADYGTPVWRVHVDGADGSDVVEADVVVNSAGLYADDVAAKIMDLTPDLRLSWTKGNYFSLRRSAPRVSRLVYPCPQEKGLGIHLTLDLDGGLRLGPDVEELSANAENYDVDAGRAESFLTAARRYMPALVRADLAPAYSGLRGQRTMSGFRDFYIAEESARGAPGWINLIGIDSPGLTASLAIADYVAGLLFDGDDSCA